MNVGVPKLVSIDAKKTDGQSTVKGVRKSRTQAVASVARTGLEEVGVPIVIDDFHHIEDAQKQAVARAVKSVIAPAGGSIPPPAPPLGALSGPHTSHAG